MAFVIKYRDGSYNQGLGFPVSYLREATRYDTKAEAEAIVTEICDVLCIEELHADNKRIMPRQDSVTDQLKDLIVLANQNGMYDAADWIMSKLGK